MSFESAAAESDRIPFVGPLGVANFDGQQQPAHHTFEPVAGYNLSHSGISFATYTWPSTDRLMVALGDERAPVLVSARVLACHRLPDQDEPDSFEVHCEFDRWYT